MREVIDHKCVGLDDEIRVEVADVPEDEERRGVVPHKYQLYLRLHGNWEKAGRVEFQKGPYRKSEAAPAAVPNGISVEALLAIAIDRLRCLQAGPLSCRENAIAITEMESALLRLHQRTRDRVRRGVEGTNEK